MKVETYRITRDGEVTRLPDQHEELVIAVREVRCPRCGAGEIHPDYVDAPIMERKLLIRGFKVCTDNGWESECLVCSGFYDHQLRPRTTPREEWQTNGWFHDGTGPLEFTEDDVFLVSWSGRHLVGFVKEATLRDDGWWIYYTDDEGNPCVWSQSHSAGGLLRRANLTFLA